jgi:hypothetical protein
MKKYSIFVTLILLFIGCEAALLISPAIQAYVTWKDGEAYKYYNYNFETSYRATEKALHDLNYTITKNELTKKGYYFLATANDQFKINVESKEKNVTCIRIRINFMGDKPYAELIYKAIDDNLNIIEYINGVPKSPKQKAAPENNKQRRLLRKK